VLICLIFSTTWLAIKIGLATFAPFGYAGLRYLIACPILFAIARARRLRWPQGVRGYTIPVLLGVLMFALPFALIYHAEDTVPSGLASVLFASHAIFVALLAHRFLAEERLTAARILGVVIGFGGVLVVFFERMEGSGTWLGEAALVLCALVQAVSLIIVRRTQRETPAVVLSCIGSGVAALVLLASSALFERSLVRHFSWNGVLALLYLAVFGSVIAFTVAIYLMHAIGANRIAMSAYIIPLLALVVGALALGEPLGARLILGAALVIGGVGLTTRSARTARTTPSEA